VDELVHLRFGGGDDLGVAVSRVDDGDAGEAVEVVFAGGVVNDATFSAGDDDGLHGFHEAGDDIVFVLLDGVAHDVLYKLTLAD